MTLTHESIFDIIAIVIGITITLVAFWLMGII